MSLKKNYFYGITTVLIWSTLAAVVKSLLSDIPNLEALSVSGLLAFLFLLVLNVINGSIRKVKDYSVGQFGIMAGLGFLGLFLYSALYYYGISQLSSQEACILNYLWPIMLVIFSVVFLKEKLTPVKLVALLCSFVGIILLTQGSGSGGGENRVYGMICCIIAAACYGLFAVLNKKVDFDQNITMMVIWLTVAVCAGLLSMLTETWRPIRGFQWAGMLWLGIVIDAVAYLLWALALRGTDNTTSIANLAYLTPFLSLIVSAVFLNERIQARAVVALLFIVGGILMQSVYETRTGGKKEKSI